MAQHKPKKQKTDWRKRIIAIMAVAMVLIMMLPMLTMLLPRASAASIDELESQIAASKAEAAQLAGQVKDMQAKLDAVRSDKAQALSAKSILEQQIAVQQQSITAVESTIAQYDQLIVEKQAEIEQTEADEAAQFELFCQRVRAMEEEGDVTYWDILFSSESFSDLLDRAVFIIDVMEADNAIMDGLVELRNTLTAQQTDLETARGDQDAQRVVLEEQKATLKAEEAEVDVLLADIRADETTLANAESALKSAANQLGAEITKKQKELEAAIAAGKISFDPSSGWQWPVPGYYVITSLFANRKHPITGVYGHHTGTDVGVPSGVPILAPANGVVLISTYGSAYGNYVLIQHQNGIQTLCAHMSSRKVKEGQVVNQGDVIGYIGSTGSSTAPHLHFEFRVNGVLDDALKYYPSIDFDFSHC